MRLGLPLPWAPSPPRTQISLWEEVKFKGNIDLGSFWYTKLWVPDPPPPFLSSNTAGDIHGQGNVQMGKGFRLEHIRSNLGQRQTLGDARNGPHGALQPLTHHPGPPKQLQIPGSRRMTSSLNKAGRQELPL